MKRAEIIGAIRRWKAQNELAVHARELCCALSSVEDWETRERVGYALRDVSQEALGESFALTRIAIVGNCTLDGLDHLLRARLVEQQILPEFYLAGFDQYVRELLDPESGLYRHKASLTLCVLDEHVASEAVERAWQLEVVAQVLDEKYATLERLVGSFTANSTGTLALSLPLLSAETLASVIDYRSKARLSALWRDFQRRLLTLSEIHPRVLVLDTDVLLQTAGVALRDARLAFHGAMYLSQALLDVLAGEIVGVVRALNGRSKKCLMLDLDDTLWGGILGEVGAAGLELGDSARGKAHRELQRIARGLKEQGVLLAINSKNDLANVREVLETHPDLTLRSGDFVAIEANWQPKSENTRRIVEKLNLGADSLVFLDDSDFERRLVSETIPGVSAPWLPPDATLYPSLLLRGGWFNVLALTAEDRERTTLYQREARRDELKASAGSFDEYLSALDIEIALVVPDDEHRLARLAQLGQRTNQFNLTGSRHQAGELRQMLAEPRFSVLGIEGRDRFGDYGLVGSVLIEKRGPKQDDWWIRTFLLSCRVFERSIEHAVLRSILDDAQRAGARSVHGEFVLSKKNGRFEAFYTSQGFSRLEPNGSVQVYRHELESLPALVPWISIRKVKQEVAA